MFVLIFSGEDEEEVVCHDSQVTQEMLEEQIVRKLTREVLDLLCKFSKLLQFQCGLISCLVPVKGKKYLTAYICG